MVRSRQARHEMPSWNVSAHIRRALKMPLHDSLQSGDPFGEGFGTGGASLQRLRIVQSCDIRSDSVQLFTHGCKPHLVALGPSPPLQFG